MTLLVDWQGVVQGRAKEIPPRAFEVCLCREWLALAQPVKTPRVNSYHLKHVVERWADQYISNGEFIQAAIEMNFPIKHGWDDGLNVWVGVSKRSLKRLRGCKRADTQP